MDQTNSVNSKGVSVLQFFLLLLFVIVNSRLAQSQDTIWVWTYPSASDLTAQVMCRVSFDTGYYSYIYTVSNSASSNQSVESFYTEFNSAVGSIYSPSNWFALKSRTKQALMWFAEDSLSNIPPGNNLTGYTVISQGLPAIFSFYIRGHVFIPVFEEGTPDSTIGGDVFENSFKGRTIAPRTPPTPFNALTFLDTITSYITESRTLGWITNDPTANKYKRLIDTARFHLQANNRGVAKAKLDSVLVNVYPDSAAGLITSEAYALLRFNTEYLLMKLSEE
jgi:hypothetical protein